MDDITIQDVFERFLPEYAESKNFSERQFLTVKCIQACRTAEMGAHVSECDSCHNTYIHYNSCKNRHCPMCQGMDVDVWIDKQQENVLNTPYFHANGGAMVPVSVKGTEFIRMFLMHVLPKGFVRIRHYGLLSCRNKKEKMTLCRNLLGCEQYISRLRDKTTAEKILILYNRDICKCRYCGEPVHTYKVSGRYMLC